MQPILTTVSGSGVHFRLADHADAMKATEWIDIQVKRSDLKHGSGTLIPELELQFLAELQVAALNHALQLIQTEIRRLKNMGRERP